MYFSSYYSATADNRTKMTGLSLLSFDIHQMGHSLIIQEWGKTLNWVSALKLTCHAVSSQILQKDLYIQKARFVFKTKQKQAGK